MGRQHEDASPFAAVIGEGFDLRKPLRRRNCWTRSSTIRPSQPAMPKIISAEISSDRGNASVTGNGPATRKIGSPLPRPLRGYPSGTRLGYSVGVILAALIPEKGATILRSADYAYSREGVWGSHHRRSRRAVLRTAVGVMLLHNTARVPQFGSSEGGVASGAPHGAIADQGCGPASSGGRIVTACGGPPAPRHERREPRSLTARISFPSMVAKTPGPIGERPEKRFVSGVTGGKDLPAIPHRASDRSNPWPGCERLLEAGT
jgi:hypothetical protein